jgi:4-hydroxyphenylpyruvate dioxygenase
MNDSLSNPMGTDGFEFVEYTAPDPQLLRTLFERHGVAFQSAPDSYYEGVDARVQGHGESLAVLKERAILIDGNPSKGESSRPLQAPV